MPDMPTDLSTVLVVGGGGREHALAWAMAKSRQVHRVVVAPGNGGTAMEPEMVNAAVAATDAAGLVALAARERAGLAVIGPEAALEAGVSDALRDAGVPVFGPSRAAAVLETSKSWARGLMQRHGLPHPRFVVADTREAAEKAVRDRGGRCVIKADGLASGKGVIVAGSEAEALRAVEQVLVERAFGHAGDLLLVEDRLEGDECSIMVITDGEAYQLLPAAQDHKRLLDGDRGPNTGGMGAYAPAPIAEGMIDTVRTAIIEPALAGMRAEGRRFEGCLYCGLILTRDGPFVIEFNARFGDPETQAQIPLVASDLALTFAAVAAGRLAAAPMELKRDKASVTVIVAPPGYPGATESGRVVEGLAEAAALPGVKVFHAGTALIGDSVFTTGGRALAVTSTQASLAAARDTAYGAIGEDGVHFQDMQFRRDIAARAVR